MIFGLTFKDKDKPQIWFAWRPVQLTNDGRWIWWEKIIRQRDGRRYSWWYSLIKESK